MNETQTPPPKKKKKEKRKERKRKEKREEEHPVRSAYELIHWASDAPWNSMPSLKDGSCAA